MSVTVNNVIDSFFPARTIGNCWGRINHTEELGDMQKVGKTKCYNLYQVNYRLEWRAYVTNLMQKHNSANLTLKL